MPYPLNFLSFFKNHRVQFVLPINTWMWGTQESLISWLLGSLVWEHLSSLVVSPSSSNKSPISLSLSAIGYVPLENPGWGSHWGQQTQVLMRYVRMNVWLTNTGTHRALNSRHHQAIAPRKAAKIPSLIGRRLPASSSLTAGTNIIGCRRLHSIHWALLTNLHFWSSNHAC